MGSELRTFMIPGRQHYHLAVWYDTVMSTCSDSICENSFETSHVRFIHENFSVMITTPLDQIQQNLLRKETCQNTAKPADIVLKTSFEEYPTLP